MNGGGGQELKNIMYKAKFFKEDSPSAIAAAAAASKNNSENLDSFLDKERENIKKETWSRLDKTIKIQKLDEYVESISEKNQLTQDEIAGLKSYLANSIDRKKLQCVKDVIYDKTTQKIKSIPCLLFNTTTRTYTLKRSEKRVSTLKSLGPVVNNKKKVITMESLSENSA
jgi:predicted RNase H-like nuclease (RuvC/YqgF family)